MGKQVDVSKPTHEAIMRGNQSYNKNAHSRVFLVETKDHWVSTISRVFFRKSDGLMKGRVDTSTYRLDLSTLKPIGEANEKA